jgi:hypothetical protein
MSWLKTHTNSMLVVTVGLSQIDESRIDLQADEESKVEVAKQ